MDEFLVHAVNIGDLVKIRVAHDNSGILGSPWYLDRIDIKSDMLDRTWTFQFGRWIARGELEVEMYPQQENSIERNYDSYKSPQGSLLMFLMFLFLMKLFELSEIRLQINGVNGVNFVKKIK